MALIKGTCDEWEAIKERKEQEQRMKAKPSEAFETYINKLNNIENDPVKHPAHYTDGKYECIDYIHCKGYGFDLGNAVKYITRAGKKSPDKKIEDLRKAMQYLDFYLNEVREPIEDYIPTVQYCDDKELSMLLTAAMIHIDHAHTTPMPERKRTYSEVAKACIEAYILKLTEDNGAYDKEMVGNRTE